MFAHLYAHSAFSFLNGSSSVESLVLRAAQLGQSALVLTDTGSLTGIPSLVRRCQQAGIKPLGGCTVGLSGLGAVTLLANGPTGWASLCRLLTTATLRDVKREATRARRTPTVDWEDLEADHAGLVCLSRSAQQGRLAALLRLR